MSTCSDAIAKYGLEYGEVLKSWLRTFNFVRNDAAHHSRLWNRVNTDSPVLPPAGEMSVSMPDEWMASKGARPTSKVSAALIVFVWLLACWAAWDWWSALQSV